MTPEAQVDTQVQPQVAGQSPVDFIERGLVALKNVMNRGVNMTRDEAVDLINLEMVLSNTVKENKKD